MQLAFQLFDPELQMSDQRFGVGQLCLRAGGFSHGRITLSLDPLPRFTLDQQRRLGSREVRRKIIRLQIHEASEIRLAGKFNHKMFIQLALDATFLEERREIPIRVTMTWRPPKRWKSLIRVIRFTVGAIA